MQIRHYIGKSRKNKTTPLDVDSCQMHIHACIKYDVNMYVLVYMYFMQYIYKYITYWKSSMVPIMAMSDIYFITISTIYNKHGQMQFSGLQNCVAVNSAVQRIGDGVIQGFCICSICILYSILYISVYKNKTILYKVHMDAFAECKNYVFIFDWPVFHSVQR